LYTRKSEKMSQPDSIIRNTQHIAEHKQVTRKIIQVRLTRDVLDPKLGQAQGDSNF